MRIPVPDFTLVLTFMLRASFRLSFTRPRRPPEWLSRVEDLLKNGFQENLTLGEVGVITTSENLEPSTSH